VKGSGEGNNLRGDGHEKLARADQFALHERRVSRERYPMSELRKAFKALRTCALAYPETREDLPWGESAIKVRGKSFLFMHCDGKKLGLSVKLSRNREFALEYPFTSPTAYGLGKSGWVSSRFEGKAKPPLDILEAWIDESYRNIAPTKLVDALTVANALRPTESAAAPSRPSRADRGERHAPRLRKSQSCRAPKAARRKSPRRRRPA
jgi:predicted DNA-binding protein (MmcQ/YjbR family)